MHLRRINIGQHRYQKGGCSVMGFFLFCYLTISPAMGETKASSKAKIKATPSVNNQPSTGPTMMDEQLVDKQQTEQIIHSLLDSHEWESLPPYLDHYDTLAGKDEVLLHYARGVLRLVNHQYDDAITEFRSGITLDPNNIDVRIGLAISLYENNQFEAAQDQFYKINSAELTDKNRDIVERYQAKILKKNSWDYSLNFDFMNSNKVSDDSYERILQVGEKEPSRKLTHSTLGGGYKFGINKNFALQENHYIVPSIELKGWSYSESVNQYSEGTLTASAGYLYMTPKAVFKLTPFAQETMVNHEFFVRSMGVEAEVRRPLNENWQAVDHYTYTKKAHYRDLYTDFDGQLQDAGVTLINIYSPTLKMWGGVHFAADRVRARSQSSNKKGIEFGLAKEWPWGMSTQLSMVYNQRDYLGNHTEMNNQRRKDEDYIGTISIWHRNVYIWGITPRVNYMFRRIDSSIPALYSQKYHQLFFTLEKNF